MDIRQNKKRPNEIKYKGHDIKAVHRGGFLVWIKELIMSCFGSGKWINNKPWLNNNAWKN